MLHSDTLNSVHYFSLHATCGMYKPFNLPPASHVTNVINDVTKFLKIKRNGSKQSASAQS